MIELVVSIGVLSILLVIAGSVFTLTLKSSGQATALIEVSEHIRAFEETLRQELRSIQPGRSIMIIQPNVIHGLWMKDEMDLFRAGENLDAEVRSPRRDPERERIVGGNLERELPRADILAFFTDQPATSFRDSDVAARTQFVVYGHAQIGEFKHDVTGRWADDPAGVWKFADFRLSDATVKFDQPTGSQLRGRYTFLQRSEPPNHDIFPFAAAEWHLARRSVLIVDRNLSDADTPPHYPAESLNDSVAVVGSGDDDDPRYDQLKKANYVRDGRRDYIVNEPGGAFDFERDIVQAPANPEDDVDQTIEQSLVNWIGRAQLSTSPTFAQSGRLGAYFLPQCASFKVEWALDTSDIDYGSLKGTTLPGASEIVWIDPAHLVERVTEMQPVFDDYYENVCSDMFSSMPDALRCQQRVVAIEKAVIGKLVPLDPRWSSLSLSNCLEIRDPARFIDPGTTSSSPLELRSTHIFYPTKPLPPCDPPPELPDPLFPKALRVTIDVFDPAGRLERPIRHVMVLPVGQE